MKKFFILTLAVCLAACLTSGCKRQPDYFDYVSEKRTNIYLYSDDGLEIKIYLSQRESPYSSDGIKGEISALTEIYVSLPKNEQNVYVSVSGLEGQMNYKAVENCYYLSSSSSSISGDSTQVTLTVGEESKTYSAVSVLYDGVITCEQALQCVIERDGQLFEELTENKVFCGEIYVRLLYDDGCYYYVGVCDRNSKISAYLVDGVRGKIIATKQLEG